MPEGCQEMDRFCDTVRTEPPANLNGVGARGPAISSPRAPLPRAHEVHAPVVLGAGDPPADDGPVAVAVDVLDRELDDGVTGAPLFETQLHSGSGQLSDDRRE